MYYIYVQILKRKTTTSSLEHYCTSFYIRGKQGIHFGTAIDE